MNTLHISTILSISMLGCTTGKSNPYDTAVLNATHDNSGQDDDNPNNDSGNDTTPEDTGADTEPPSDDAEIDYRLTGPYPTTASTITVTASCSASADLFTPTTEGDWPRIFLSHGFMRGPTQMVGWAEHLASWGMEVVVPTLCHASIVDTDHAQNGTDLTEFNNALGGGPVVYAGHSAGGLASLIAASQDDDAVGLIGLDLTDADGLGASSASGVGVPTYALVGEPNACNASGNGVDTVRATPEVTIVRIAEADHCDFENETDWMCTTLCDAPGATFSDSEIQEAILGLLTAAAMSVTGQDPAASTVWWQSGGLYFDQFNGTGAISSL
jgi:hypothetical protein